VKPVWKKWLGRLLAGGLGVALVCILGWVFAPALLVVDSGVAKADAVVVLGGEPWTRPKRAAEVYRETKAEILKAENLKEEALGVADGRSQQFQPVSVSASQNLPLVIVSGKGDCEGVRLQIEAGGVPAKAILTECASRSTWENAQFSVKLLRQRGITNVVLVTSWYHSRRSLACFVKVAPEMNFSARPTDRPPSGLSHPDSYTVKRVFQEYAKVAYYWVVHGVPPWL
jgi:uncharacterized SAM-binding protein YcdF (DUF218 family)